MHPDAVLSDKQKEVRFQKFMQKKRGDISISGNAAGVSGSSNGSSDKVPIETNLVTVTISKTVFLIDLFSSSR
jgi:hypothetical protein